MGRAHRQARNEPRNLGILGLVTILANVAYYHDERKNRVLMAHGGSLAALFDELMLVAVCVYAPPGPA
jgi:hypothetical protein